MFLLYEHLFGNASLLLKKLSLLRRSADFLTVRSDKGNFLIVAAYSNCPTSKPISLFSGILSVRFKRKNVLFSKLVHLTNRHLPTLVLSINPLYDKLIKFAI